MNDKTLVRYYDADKNRFLNGELSGCDGDCMSNTETTVPLKQTYS